MRRFAVGCLAVFGFLCLLIVVAFGVGAYVLFDRFSPVDQAEFAEVENAVLLVDLRGPLIDGPEPDPFVSAFSDIAAPTLNQVSNAITSAKNDDGIIAMVVRLSGDSADPAMAQALHRKISEFSASGKPVIAHASSFGEFGSGTYSYMIATAADTIALSKGGSVGVTGLSASVPFAAETLALAGLQADVGRRGPFKTAPEVATETSMSPDHREMLESLTGDLFSQVLATISESRNLEPATVQQLVDTAPIEAEEALDRGLVDQIVTWQDMDDILGEFGASKYDLFPIDSYQPLPPDATEARVALIHASGPIIEGSTPDSPFGPQGQIASDDLSLTINDAFDDTSFDAIILRIDSGGGSAIASEVIANAIDSVTESDMPFVVTMGSAAASGGYWLSAPADSIVAEAGTITGSIGVFAGKLVTRDLWERLGVNWDGVKFGDHADMFSILQPFSNSERVRLEGFLDTVYDDFLRRVAEGRGMTTQAVDVVAQGRVWTGAQALERGLVDRLGGIDEAVDEARQLLNLPDGTEIEVVPYPPPVSVFDRVADLASGNIQAATSHPRDLVQLIDKYTKMANSGGLARMAPVVINGTLY